MVLFKFFDVRAITNPVVDADPNAEGHWTMAATMSKTMLVIFHSQGTLDSRIYLRKPTMRIFVRRYAS